MFLAKRSTTLNLNGRCSPPAATAIKTSRDALAMRPWQNQTLSPAVSLFLFFIHFIVHTHIYIYSMLGQDLYSIFSRPFRLVFIACVCRIEFSGDDYRNLRLMFAHGAIPRLYKFNIGLCRRTRFLFVYCVCFR